MKLCSACLLGVTCRWDGKSKPCEKVLQLLRKEILIPVCPEQLGGLPTPREPSEQHGAKVFSKSGKDVTIQFVAGATETLKLAKLFGVKEAILKQASPSCGSGRIPDGTFSGKSLEGDGVTTALLKKNGISVISEEDL
ncbi:MAG: DUF523 domain-containing protein [Candidatus Woesearchaeota archaeon]